jgi:hypothetical protein
MSPIVVTYLTENRRAELLVDQMLEWSPCSEEMLTAR